MGFRALRLRDQFDLVHVHAHPAVLRGLGPTPLVMSEGSSSAVYLADYLGWDAARLGRGYRRARRLYRLLGIHDRLLALERVSQAYVLSHWARELNLRWGADPAKLDVIYPGFATPPLPQREVGEHFTFLFVGGDFERKGGFEVVEAFDQLLTHNQHVRLILAGSDPNQRNPDRLSHSWVSADRRRGLSARLAELIRADHVQQISWVDQQQLRQSLYPGSGCVRDADAGRRFGFTSVEAMSFGLPVITSTVGPSREIVEEGVTGLIVEPGDVDALRDAMGQLAADPLRARKLGLTARARFEAKFTLARFQAELGNLYRRAVGA